MAGVITTLIYEINIYQMSNEIGILRRLSCFYANIAQRDNWLFERD